MSQRGAGGGSNGAEPAARDARPDAPDPGLGPISLASAEVELVVLPETGGRVVSLVDRCTGRDWLVPDPNGPAPAAATIRLAQDAVFDGDVAFGWDECLPTVGKCRDPHGPAGATLRDHGDGWGRPVELVVSRDPATGTVAAIRTAWSVAGRYEFARTLSIAGPTVSCEYVLGSLGVELPFLWSMHPLLALAEGSTLEIGPVDRVVVSQLIGLDLADGGTSVGWPDARLASGGTVDLSVVRGVEARTAIKAYVPAASGPVVVRQPDGAELILDWDRRVAPVLGIWIDAGGWPADDGRHQVALEPATAPFDDLAAAFDAGHASWLPAGGQLTWWTTMTVASRWPSA